MFDVPAIDPISLKAELEGPAPPKLLDVREEEELSISSLPNAIHIPLYDLPERADELDPSDNLVVICRVGGRSAHAVAYLLNHGFQKVRNLSGGLNGWSREVDPTLREY
jgi:adenylyltransferase/sulfurtransferase